MSEPTPDPPHGSAESPGGSSAPAGPGAPSYGTPGSLDTPGTPQAPRAPGSPQAPRAPGSPAGRPVSGSPLRPDEERNWAIAAHLSSFLAAYVALGLLGPLIVMLVTGPRSPFVRRHAVEALNFNLTVLIYVAVSVLLMLVVIGFFLIAAVGVLYLVTVIRGAMAASRGEEYRYPFTIRFVS